MRRLLHRIRTWIPARRYEPRHMTPVLSLADCTLTPNQIRELQHAVLEETPVATLDGHPLGSIRVWAPEAERLPEPDRHLALVPGDPADAIFDAELSWHSAWKAHERGDDNAVQKWLEAGWLADAWWLRRTVAA